MNNVEIANFLWASISSGVIGNAAYDGIKAILGSAFDRLVGHANAQKRAEFDAAVHAILETNQEIRNTLSSVASGTSISISQHHSGTGDNVAGDKIVNNHHAPNTLLVNDNNGVRTLENNCPNTGTASIVSSSLSSREQNES